VLLVRVFLSEFPEERRQSALRRLSIERFEHIE
jgi:hypothetical protein